MSSISPTRPQSSKGQRPQTSKGQRPQTSKGQRPGTSHRKRTVEEGSGISHYSSQDLTQLWQWLNETKLDSTPILQVQLKCFVPEYLPAIGDIDPMLKIPINSQDKEILDLDQKLGIYLLDEPAAQQSDPKILDFQLKSSSLFSSQIIKSMDMNQPTSKKQLYQFCQSVLDMRQLQQQQKSNLFLYKSGEMPDLETLMSEWQPEIEIEMQTIVSQMEQLSKLPLSVEECSRLCCAILDIPVYDSLKESINVLFRLYLGFKKSGHFT